MSTLAYIEELGIGNNPDDNDTEVESNDTIEEESKEDFVQDAEDDTSEETKGDTEPNSELLNSLKKQIEGMEKRLADKDDYINQLREASKQREAEKQQEVNTDSDDEEDFWSDPETIIKKQKAEIMQQKEQARIQQLQIAEIHYANTVDDYWKTVNQESLKEAVSTDAKFANEFRNSNQPYKIAYEYLKNMAKTKADSEKALKDKIIQEYLKENGIDTKKTSKEIPPNINNGGKSSSSGKEAPTDGFAAVFGSKY